MPKLGTLQHAAAVIQKSTDGQKVKGAILNGHNRLVDSRLILEQIAQSGTLGNVQKRAKSRAAEVGIDQESADTRVATTRRELGGQRRFPFRADGTCDHNASTPTKLQLIATHGEPQMIESLDELLDLIAGIRRVQPANRPPVGQRG